MHIFAINSLIIKFFTIFAAKSIQTKTVEPPSPIIEKLNSSDQMSDDPLSNSVFMIMGNASGEEQEAVSVCAWSAQTGLSYIGTPSSTLS